MGRIPEYERIGPLAPVPQDAEYLKDAATSAGLADVTRAAGDAVKTYQQYEIQKDQIRARNHLTEQIVDYENQKDQLYNDWENAYRDDPQGSSEKLKWELEGLRDKFMEKAYNPWSRNQFEDAINRSNNGTYRKALAFEDKTLMENTQRAAEKGANHLLSKLYREPTPKNYDASFKASEGVFQDLQNTFDPRVFEQMRDGFKKAAAQTMFQGMLDKDMVGPAEAALNSKKYDEALGPDGISQVSNAIKRRKKLRSAKAKDYSEMKVKNPYKFLTKMGEKIIPLDPTDPESFLHRANLRESAKKKYGVNLPMIAPLEEYSLFDVMSRMTPRQRAEAFSRIGQVPKEYYIPYAQQIAQTKPEYAIAIDLMREGTPRDFKRAVEIFEGADFLQKSVDGKGESSVLPPRKQVDSAIDAAIGSTFRNADNRDGLRRTIRGMYALKRMDNGIFGTKFDEEYDTAVINKTVTDLIGTPYNFNGKDILPFRNENGDHANTAIMEAIFNNINHETLQKAFGTTAFVLDDDGKTKYPFDFNAGIDRIRLIKTNGGYFIEFKDGFLYTNNTDKKEKFIFDLKKFYDANKEIIQKYDNRGFWQRAWDSFGSGSEKIEVNK